MIGGFALVLYRKMGLREAARLGVAARISAATSRESLCSTKPLSTKSGYEGLRALQYRGAPVRTE